MVFRLIGGLGIGGSSVLGPVYIAELAPAQWRGRMVGLFQINVVTGILLAYLSNYVISLLNLGHCNGAGSSASRQFLPSFFSSCCSVFPAAHAG